MIINTIKNQIQRLVNPKLKDKMPVGYSIDKLVRKFPTKPYPVSNIESPISSFLWFSIEEDLHRNVDRIVSVPRFRLQGS